MAGGSIRFRQGSGFTLVEMLVVTAILTILIALLLPSLSKAQKTAHSTVCLSNLREINIAYQMYVQDNQGKSFNLVETQTGYWMAQLMPYHNNLDKIRFCPEATLTAVSASSYFGTAGTAWYCYNDYGSYGLNLWLCRNYIDSAGVTHASGSIYAASLDLPQDTVELPTNGTSDIPVVADCDWVGGWPMESDTLPASLNGGYVSNPNHLQRFVMNRHGIRTNVSFLDGHSEAIPLGAVWQISWHLGWVPRNVYVPQ